MICVCDVFLCPLCQGRGGWEGVWEGVGWWECGLFDFQMNICTVQFDICALKMNKKLTKNET